MNPMAVRTCRNHSATPTRAATRTRAAWHRAAAAAAALLCLCTASTALNAATLAEGKAAAAAGDHPRAATIFSTVRDSGAAAERAEAAFLALYEHREAGNHAAVQAQYDASLAATRGTRFESRCMFEYAKSLHYNSKDTTEAMRLYERISEEFPTEAFSASGSILEMGRIQLKDWAAPHTACDTFELALSQYPDSPFADDALLAQAQAAVLTRRLDVIDNARARLEAMGAAPLMRQKVQFERAEFFNKGKGDRYTAAEEYKKVFEQFDGNTGIAALARIRYADLVPRGEFKDALALYQRIQSDNPALEKKLADWVQCRIAICQYQLENEAAARTAFEQLLARNPEEKLRMEARRHLDGMANPDSTSSLLITYDRGMRFRSVQKRTDKCFWAMQRVIKKSGKDFFRQWAEDGSVDREERAQMLYRKCFALWWCGYSSQAYTLAGEILDTLQPQGIARYECLYLRAYLLTQTTKWSEAVAAWRSLVEMNPPFEILAPGYIEYGIAQFFDGDPLGAVMTLEECAVRFPSTVQADEAMATRQDMLDREPAILAKANELRPSLIAKWKQMRPPIRELSDSVPEIPAISSTGGAE